MDELINCQEKLKRWNGGVGEGEGRAGKGTKNGTFSPYTYTPLPLPLFPFYTLEKTKMDYA